MMIEQATVIGYQNGIARVQCQVKSSCGGCEQNGCGTKALSALAGEKFSPSLELKVDQPLQIGDKIELGLAERSLLFSVLWLYGLPLLVVVVASLLFSAWFENELLVALLVFCSVIITFSMIKKWLSASSQAEIQPVFLRKI